MFRLLSIDIRRRITGREFLTLLMRHLNPRQTYVCCHCHIGTDSISICSLQWILWPYLLYGIDNIQSVYSNVCLNIWTDFAEATAIIMDLVNKAGQEEKEAQSVADTKDPVVSCSCLWNVCIYRTRNMHWVIGTYCTFTLFVNC